jgi:cytosine/adenosine deaminase-related metal-dependent hydrolase
VLPISSAPHADGVVAVEDGRITYVGPIGNAPRGEDRDLGDVLLLPGLVNTHCHLELTAMRGFLEDLDFRDWIIRLTTAKRTVLSREMLLDSARYGIAEGLRHGITTYADTCDSGVAFDAMQERSVRGIMYQEVFGPDPSQCAGSLAELRAKIVNLRSRETPLVRVGVSPHAPYTVSDALFSAVAQYARSESLPVAIHIAESLLEQDLVTNGSGAFADGLRARGIEIHSRGRTPIDLLASLGVLEARPLLIHCIRVDSADIQCIARSHASITHCPASNAKLGHGVAPLSEILEARIPTGLGSDSMASNNRMDLLEEARLAVFFQRGRLGRFDEISAETALRLATLGGAEALGLEGEIGCLAPGKAADLAAFPLRSIGPVHDPISSAVFALPGTAACFVAVAGNELVRDGALLNEDGRLENRVQGIANSLQDWLRSR